MSRPEHVPGFEGDAVPPEHQGQEHQEQQAADEPEFLGGDREDEVRVVDRD